MQKHGLLADPESQKANAMGNVDVSINRHQVTGENVDQFFEGHDGDDFES